MLKKLEHFVLVQDLGQNLDRFAIQEDNAEKEFGLYDWIDIVKKGALKNKAKFGVKVFLVAATFF
jgi:hypothetical protein